MGLGSMGTRRVRNLQYLNQGEIIGYDIREERRQNAQNKYGITLVNSLEEGLSQVDAVIISTSPEAHIKIAKKALYFQKPCFMELNVILDTEYDELVKLSKEKNILVAPSCTRRFKKSIKMLKRFVETNKIGKVLTVNHHWGMNLQDWHPWEDIADYYVGKRETGGAREMVCFELSWLPWIFGYPKKVMAIKDKMSKFKVDIDDVYQIIMVNKNSILNISIDVISKPPHKTTVVIGDKGKIVFDEMQEKLFLYELGKEKPEIFEEMRNLAVKGYLSADDKYVDELKYFLGVLKNENKWPYSLEDDRRNLSLLLQIEKSAQLGSIIKITV